MSMQDRFAVTEIEPCMCGMRVFLVFDRQEGDTQRAHVGNLNPYDKGHDAVKAILRAEREKMRAENAASRVRMDGHDDDY